MKIFIIGKTGTHHKFDTSEEAVGLVISDEEREVFRNSDKDNQKNIHMYMFLPKDVDDKTIENLSGFVINGRPVDDVITELRDLMTLK